MSVKMRLLLLAGLAFVLFLFDIVAGSVSIPLSQVIAILMGRSGETAAWRDIIILFRLPRAFTALIAGIGLSIGGLNMQTLFRNPLAGPSVLGINAGANLAVAVLVLFLGSSGGGFISGLSFGSKAYVAAAAVIGASSVLVVILLVSRYISSITLLLLFGLMFGYLANSLVTLLIHFSAASQIQAYIQWTFGSFSSTTWTEIALMLPVGLLLLAPAVFLIKPLNALLLGEEYARSMGVHIAMVRILIISVTSVFAGMVTAFCGPVTFLGVAVPHIARGVMETSDHRLVLPATIIIGASVALLADLISHVPGSPGVLPLNAVTSLLGVPVVLWVLLRRQKRGGIV